MHVLVLYLIIIVCECVLTPVDMADEIHFDFTIHHGGNFEWNPSLEYVGGEVSTMANVDPDLLSHFKVQDIFAKAGGPINSRIYYLIPSGDLEQGLRLINSDDDVTYMLNGQQMKSHFM